MSDETKTPRVTEAQHAAWQRLNEMAAVYTPEMEVLLRLRIAPLLPSELTEPQPALPTEPGHYLTPQESVVTLDDEGDWIYGDGGLITRPEELIPLRRLVPERQPITPKQLSDVYREATGDYMIDDGLVAMTNFANRTE